MSEQDWEQITWKKSKKEAAPIFENVKQPFYRKLINARYHALLTRHKLAQSLGIKVKELESYETGKTMPKKSLLARINKMLDVRLSLKDD